MSKPSSPWQVPLADVNLGPEEEAAVLAVLRSGWLSMGPQTAAFEQQFQEFLGVKHALAVANGTAALHLACEALGLGPGDEVLCPALTFVATANAILYPGAKPVFVDISGEDNLNLSVTDAAAKIGPRTRAIMVVHYGGYPCDLAAIRALAARHNLKIIEDCAHAPGALYQGPDGPKPVGTLGDVGCFSFFANKNLTTGEGGMVVTHDDEVAARLKTLRSHGMTTLTWDRHKGHSFSYDVTARGYNYRLDEIRAALGQVQLQKVRAANARRGEIVKVYQENLRELDFLQLPFLNAPPGSSYHLFPVLLRDAGQRAPFMAHLARRGIQTSIHYPPIPRFTYYRRLWEEGREPSLPLTYDVAARLVTLPLFPTLTPEQVHLVLEAIRDFSQGVE